MSEISVFIKGAARSPFEKLAKFLEKTASQGFFGKVVITFQNGQLSDVKVEHNLKLDEIA